MGKEDKPYDRFFQSVFARPDLAWELTQIAVPDVAAKLGTPEIHVERESFVDTEFRAHQTDLLVRLTEPMSETLVYVLYEHKSAPDRFVSLQLLRYLSTIWDRHRRSRSGGALPQIIPVVLYHGRSSWKPLEFSRLVVGPGGEHVPRFTPRFLNLADVLPDQVTGSIGFVVALLGLKYVRLRLTDANAAHLAGALDAALADPASYEYAQHVERLYARTRSRSDILFLATVAADREYHRVEEGLMTFAQELLREGRQQGLEEGQLHGKRSVLLRLMSRKFGINGDESEIILSCDDPEALDAALDEMVMAHDKAAVLAKLR